MRKILILCALIPILCAGCSRPNPAAQAPTVRDSVQRKVVVIVVDSLTNRALQAAMQNHSQLPTLHFLMSRGHYLPDVVSSFPSMSVSDLSTMITGSYPEKHGIPGLVWFDLNRHVIVNYGNNLPQTLSLGSTAIAQNLLYNLNQTHLSKRVTTVFEDLQRAKFSTGAINMLIYRGTTPHTLELPAWARPFSGGNRHQVLGPDTLVLGRFTPRWGAQDKAGALQKLGLNDDFAIDTLMKLIRDKKLPDFTMVYLPSNDAIMHRQGVGALKGVVDVDQNLQRLLKSYGSRDETLRHLTLIVMGDGGVTPVHPKERNPTILLKNLFPNRSIYRWQKQAEENDDLAIAVNSRMAYIYLLHGRIKPAQAASQLLKEPRIDTVAWAEGQRVVVAKPERNGARLSFQKGGKFTDPYGQTWELQGDQRLLDFQTDDKGAIRYGKYPDALNQLWSAAHVQQGTYVIVTAKKGYQFGDDHAPRHDSGAQQASLLADDVYAPMIIAGADHMPKEPTRFVDLKAYFISLMQRARQS